METKSNHAPANATVVRLAEKLESVAAEIANVESRLAALKAREKSLSEEELPEAMRELGLTLMSLQSGTKIELKDEVFLSIPKENQLGAFQWLREHDYGGVIKTGILTSFGKGEEKVATRFATSIIKKVGAERVTINQSVHPQTLKSIGRELAEKGALPPDDIFSIHLKTWAKLTQSS